MATGVHAQFIDPFYEPLQMVQVEFFWAGRGFVLLGVLLQVLHIAHISFNTVARERALQAQIVLVTFYGGLPVDASKILTESRNGRVEEGELLTGELTVQLSSLLGRVI